ncbi:hypothetical protein [Actinocrispum wychmicini]|uniref:Tetratricopeptide repeat protein n=1 Tax=Actinocrispum wychmicini TaxID=1213861 RepID=A0A4R2IME1_9PSEU|nr:hypothetical protein [Actinocrispum wychmicini]TCO45897.1 hypothetical protein EV192_12083 [Actinocrispum wychmicini]
MVQLVTLAAGTDPRRRRVLLAAVYGLAALSVPEWARVAARPIAVAAEASALRVGPAQVETARTMLHLFSAADAAYGARATRAAVVDYLATTISPWLHVPTTRQLHHELFTVAAQLTYLCGFLCMDDELHRAAQRYFRIALNLSAEADDPVTYATTLRTMSVQAHTLHHHSQALDLAESAQSGNTAAPGATRAFLSGQLALACAATGDRYHALVHLRTAERHLDRVPNGRAVVGAHHQASMAHQRAAIRACLGDRSGAISSLQHSIEQRPVTERRSRAITLATLADLQLRHGQLEAAVATWHRFLDDYPHVGSARLDTALATLQARVRPYARTSVATALLARTTDLQQLRRQLSPPLSRRA